jgi:hypothetical protein
VLSVLALLVQKNDYCWYISTITDAEELSLLALLYIYMYVWYIHISDTHILYMYTHTHSHTHTHTHTYTHTHILASAHCALASWSIGAGYMRDEARMRQKVALRARRTGAHTLLRLY